VQRILLGTTQEIVSYPRLSPDGLVTGVPSSVTARRVPTVYEDGVDEYQAVTVDALSTTLSAVALEGDESLTLAGSVTVVAGRRYLVTDANTLRKIEVTPTNSGSVSTLYLSEPLPCDVANGSAVNGIACPVALTTNQTSEPGAGYVLFRGTVGGKVYEWDESFRVVRRITSIALTVGELTTAFPIVRQLASSTDTTLEEAIVAVWRQEMVPLLAARKVLDEDILTDDVMAPMHAAAVVRHLARMWPAAPTDFVMRLSEDYDRQKEITMARIDLAIRSQEVETPSPLEPGNETRIVRRVTR